MTQNEMKSLFIPIIKEKGKEYKKNKKIYAKLAEGGEVIKTMTSDGLETENVARKGDFIVENQTESREQYVLTEDLFQDRYVFLKQIEEGYSEYQAIGKVIALSLSTDLIEELKLEDTFYFIASWGQKMVAKKEDFLVCPPDYSEIYRIARKEFFETYEVDS